VIIKKNLEIFLRFLEKKQKFKFYFIIFLQLIGSILEAFGIALILPILGIILGQDTNLFSGFFKNITSSYIYINKEYLLIISIITILSFFILKNSVLIFVYKKIFTFAYEIQQIVKSKVYTHFINQKYYKFTEKGSSKMISTISVDLNIFTQNFVVSLLIFLTELFVLIMISLLLLIIEPSGFFLVAFITSLFVFIFLKFFKKKLHSLGEEKEIYEERMQKIINNSLNSFQITKIHNKEKFFIKKFDMFNKESSFLYGKFMFFQNIPRLFFEILIIILLSVLIFIMIKLNYTFDDIFIKVAIFSAAAFRVMPSINRLTYTYQGIMFSSSTLDKISSLANEINEIKNVKEKNNSINKKIIEFKDELLLKNICFNYGNNEVLKNLDLKIQKGQAIGIYGESGGGKTTLVNLISGLIKQDSGSVFVDNNEVNIDNSEWQKLIGYVPQNINLLDDTLINNITFSDDESYDNDFLEMISNQSQITDLIKSHGNKKIGERGLRMSGGQLQRLSIARALYKKPSILIFDEATSALDLETEKKVFNTIYSLKRKKTLIIISHNIKNLDECDVKFRLENGTLTNTAI
tara:strand:+ start:18599 stop:20332 length:1734 start_codon:yes stop_codon:yes gene_type:complete